ncbi:MAG TPA: hypothetical protein VG993_00940 [Actinomycetota bacterium]|nr:hypothetical protein [Actinomycetota bacterium]
MIRNEALSVSPVPATNAKVWPSPTSGSIADRVPTAVPAGSFSATVAFVSSMPVGGAFVGGGSVSLSSAGSVQPGSAGKSASESLSSSPSLSHAGGGGGGGDGGVGGASLTSVTVTVKVSTRDRPHWSRTRMRSE